MPVSVWMLSVLTIVITVNWFISGNLAAKMHFFLSRRDLMMLSAIFAMYLLWLINTSDFKGAAHDLKLALPVLCYPLVIGTSGKITARQLKIILVSLIAGCMVAVGAGLLTLAGLGYRFVDNSRDLALFVPSTRLIVLLNLAIFSALWMGLNRNTGSLLFRIVLVAAAVAMTFFIFRLLSVTGVIILLILLGGTGIYLLFRPRCHLAGLAFIATAAAISVFAVCLLIRTWNNLHVPDNPSLNAGLKITASGNHYTHYPEETLLENGYLVWMNVCEDELRKEWNERSVIRYDSTDESGNELRVTLIRYLSYLGLTKDSAAVSQLTDRDILNIQRGFANPLYAHPASPAAKAYELVWQIDRALKGTNPSGHSVTMRKEFYRAAIGIIRKHPIFGVGTGDVRQAFSEEYRVNNTPLREEYRMRAHNQYLAFALTFGIPGLVIALALIYTPWLISPERKQYVFAVFISIIFISMFNDDTFASFTGATFFSYFYTLFLITDFKNESDN